MPQKARTSKRKHNAREAIRDMKTYNNLFDKITDPANIEAAIQKAAKGKRAKHSVQRALENPVKIAAEVSEKLKAGTWQPVPLHNAREINDGIALKKRIIVCPQFIREQIVHHSVMRVCAPLFMRKFYRYSCGSVPGRGREFAARYIGKELLNRKRTKYFAKLDVKKFFDNISPLYAFRELRRTIRDKKTLLLFAKILRSNKVRMPDGTIRRGGVPIGFYTSPWIANILLNPLDHALKEICGVQVVVRYVDDILLMDSNKRRLKKAIAFVKAFLAKIKLALKREPSIHKVDKQKITFIGLVFTRGKTTMNAAAFLRACRTAKHIGKKRKLTIYDARKMLSYAGQFKHTNTRGAFKKYIEPNVNLKACRAKIQRRDKACGEQQKATPNPKQQSR